MMSDSCLDTFACIQTVRMDFCVQLALTRPSSTASSDLLTKTLLVSSRTWEAKSFQLNMKKRKNLAPQSLPCPLSLGFLSHWAMALTFSFTFFVLPVYISLPFISLPSFISSWIFLTPSLQAQTIFPCYSQVAVPISFPALICCTWAQSGGPCSSILAVSFIYLTFCTSEWWFLCSEKVVLGDQLAVPGPFALQDNNI